MIKRLSSIKITLAALLALSLLTILGTIYQVDHGLYLAQKNIFNSIIFWFYFIPLPSVKLTMIVLFLNLSAMLIYRWQSMSRKPALLLIHLSLLMLFVSSFMNSISQKDSFLTLKAPESSNISEDYYKWQFNIFENSSLIQSINLDSIKSKKQIKLKNNQEISIINKFTNSAIFDTPFAGRILKEMPVESDFEKNSPALSFEFKNNTFELQGNDQASLKHHNYLFNLSRTKYQLPFTIQLEKTDREFYPGTQIPKSYSSRISIIEGQNIQRTVTISMNKPLRYKHYTIYQSSFGLDSSGQKYSTLAIVQNPGFIFPYIATLLAALGLWLHFSTMLISYLKKSSAYLIILALVAIPQSVSAQNQIDYSLFKQITIQDQGRLKPLDTFARSLLLRFSGRTQIDSMNHIEWLALSLFKPQQINHKAIFLINNPEIIESLGIKPNHNRRYSFNTLKVALTKLEAKQRLALSKTQKAQTEFDKEYIRIFSNLCTYTHLINNFRIFFPDQDLNSKNLFQTMQNISSLEKSISELDSSQLNNLSANEARNIQTALILFQNIEGYKEFNQNYSSDQKLNLIPNLNQYESIWDHIISDSTKDKKSLILLEQIYLNHQNTKFKDSCKQYIDYCNHKSSIRLKQKLKQQMELIYNSINPILLSKIFYGLAFLLLMLSTLINKSSKAPLILILTGFTLHTIAIVSRIFILERAPVSNLFETFIFVGWISVIIGLILNQIEKNKIGLVLSSFVGLLLLLISSKFSSGDTLQVAIAVLNSNFWLSTHVICISIGYAGVFSAGIIGHIYLIEDVLKNQSKLQSLEKTIYAILAFGLCFSFLGTILGGIWADQSWGRFWGWDPKENGALLIVLWCTIMLHAKLIGLVQNRSFAIGSIIGSMIVILSWFGLNLLGIGLHSYGFNSGLAGMLIGYYSFEILFITITNYLKSRIN